MKLKTLLLFTAGIVAGGLLLVLLQCTLLGSGDSTRYVSMSLVFEECKIRDKYEQELKAIEQQSNARLAELENEVRRLKASGSDAAKTGQLEQQLLALRDQLTQEYQQKSETFERVIWEKINQKVNEYGKEQGYDYIFGAKGDGSIMYASDEKDITKEVIAYINR
jgi:outer membrane protein